jgi:hypothetical protein
MYVYKKFQSLNHKQRKRQTQRYKDAEERHAGSTRKATMHTTPHHTTPHHTTPHHTTPHHTTPHHTTPHHTKLLKLLKFKYFVNTSCDMICYCKMLLTKGIWKELCDLFIQMRISLIMRKKKCEGKKKGKEKS